MSAYKSNFAEVWVKNSKWPVKRGCFSLSPPRNWLLLTSKKWRLQSDCNDATAEVDEWKR